MALASTVCWEVRYNGNDSNAGGFDVGAGGITRATDLTAINATTSSPTVSSASYNFVAGDVGAWLHIKSGTNWISGLYQISSVAANAATINASIGSAPLIGSTNYPNSMNTTQGCATTASPTTGTWSVDYTQQSTSISISISTASSSATTTILGSFTKAHIGNTIFVPSVTNATSGYYTISAVTAGTSATLDRTWNTGVVTTVSAAVGGAFASIGQAYLQAVTTSMHIYQKYNASAYQITNASTVAGGCVSTIITRIYLIGYNSYRHDSNIETLMPTNQASGINTFSIIAAPTNCAIRNIILDGQNLTSSKAVTSPYCFNCVFMNFTNGATSSATCHRCLAINCTTTIVFLGTNCYNCAAINCTGGTGYTASCNECIATGCSVGFTGSCSSCTAYNCSSDGFGITATDQAQIVSCLSYGNTGKGFNANTKSEPLLLSCAAGGNTGTNIDAAFSFQINNKTLTVNPFINSGATINTLSDVWNAFALNNKVGGGADCRGTGLVPYMDIGAIQHSGNINAVSPEGGF